MNRKYIFRAIKISMIVGVVVIAGFYSLTFFGTRIGPVNFTVEHQESGQIVREYYSVIDNMKFSSTLHVANNKSGDLSVLGNKQSLSGLREMALQEIIKFTKTPKDWRLDSIKLKATNNVSDRFYIVFSFKEKRAQGYIQLVGFFDGEFLPLARRDV